MNAKGYMEALNAYISSHPFDGGNSGCDTALNQLYQAYVESHEKAPVEISEGFMELGEYPA